MKTEPFSLPKKLRGVSHIPSKIPWCMDVPYAIQAVEDPHTHKIRKPKKIRCPKCNRRLTPMQRDIEPYLNHGEFWFYIPPHKIRKNKVKK